jgi:hypothetical protein
MRFNNNWSRRTFLKTASAATLSALAAPYSRPVFADNESRTRNATADSVIILWMGGGMASTETFDPKRYTPFSPGLEPNKVLSTFPAIDTAVDNIKVSEGLEKVAAVMDRGALIRSYTAGDLGFILHSRHQYQWHTWLRAASDRGRAAHRRHHLARARPVEPGSSRHSSTSDSASTLAKARN